MLNSYGVVHMARIQDVEVGNSSKGYERVFSDKALGELFTKVHSTVIRNGYELESIINDRFKNNRINDLDSFVNNISNKPERIWLCPKNILKNSQFNVKGIEPDFLFFDTRNGARSCFSVEIKDGNAFDTKKSKGEIKNMKSFCSKFLKSYNRIHENDGLFITKNYYFCCFNENDHIELKNAFRGYVGNTHLLTGKAFCEKVEINDYNGIVESRKKDGEPNIDFFISELLSIDKAEKAISKKMNLESVCSIIFDFEIAFCIENDAQKNVRFQRVSDRWFMLLAELRQYDLYCLLLKKGSEANIEIAQIDYCNYLLRDKNYSTNGGDWSFNKNDFDTINKLLSKLFGSSYRQDLTINVAAKAIKRLYECFGRLDDCQNIISFLYKMGRTVIIENEEVFILNNFNGQKTKIIDI